LREQAGAFLSVLEDLDAAGFAGRRTRPSPDEVSAVLKWLAAFHARFLGVAPDDLWKVGTYWHLATRPDELQRMSHSALRKAASAIDERLNGARFRSLVHGDAKLENVCFTDAGRVALVDFQYVGGGVGVKDVAYFLSSCFTPRECARLVQPCLDDYFAALRSQVESATMEELEREWRELFPLAWVDFYRFLLGWAPGSYDPDPFSDALVADVLARL
jgi:aminoglycoside/choline kinase family phosphotransferase